MAIPMAHPSAPPLDQPAGSPRTGVPTHGVDRRRLARPRSGLPRQGQDRSSTSGIPAPFRVDARPRGGVPGHGLVSQTSPPQSGLTRPAHGPVIQAKAGRLRPGSPGHPAVRGRPASPGSPGRRLQRPTAIHQRNCDASRIDNEASENANALDPRPDSPRPPPRLHRPAQPCECASRTLAPRRRQASCRRARVGTPRQQIHDDHSSVRRPAAPPVRAS